MARVFSIAALSLLLFSTTAFAQQETALSRSASCNAAPCVMFVQGMAVPAPEVHVSRPAVLPALYVSLAALQAYDVYSTSAGLKRGAHEANAAMSGVVTNKAAFLAVKAGSTAASIWIAERMWKRNRVGAIVTLVAINGVMGAVAAHNASVLRQLQ